MREVSDTFASITDDRVLAPAIALVAMGMGASYGTGLMLGEVFRHPLKQRVSRLDRRLTRGTRSLSNPVLDRAMALMTALGEPWVLYPVTGVAALSLGARGRAKDAVVAALGIAGSASLTQMLKKEVQRSRPPRIFRRQSTSGSSYPSNHITMALATYSTLAYLLTRPRHVPHDTGETRPRGEGSARRRRRLTRWLWLPIILLSMLVGWSRVYEDVHHPSDVFGGWVTASIWVATCMGVRTLMD